MQRPGLSQRDKDKVRTNVRVNYASALLIIRESTYDDDDLCGCMQRPDLRECKNKKMAAVGVNASPSERARTKILWPLWMQRPEHRETKNRKDDGHCGCNLSTCERGLGVTYYQREHVESKGHIMMMTSVDVCNASTSERARTEI